MERKSAEPELLIINEYYAPFFAATGQLLQELAEFLAESGMKVRVVCGKNGRYSLPSRENLNGVEVVRLSNLKDGSSFRVKLLSYFSFLFFLGFFLLFRTRRNQRIMVLSTPPLISILPVFLKPMKKFFIVHNIQDVYPDLLRLLGRNEHNSLLFRVSRTMNQYILKKVDRIVLIGQSLLDQLNNHYRIDMHKVRIVENWGLKELTAIEEEIPAKSRPLRVLYTGNMGRAHGFAAILGAAEQLQREGGVEFVISGGGYNYARLQEAVTAKGIKNVRFQPYVALEELPNLIRSADVCLLVGSRESAGLILPSKFYGYAACGKPMIYITSGRDDLVGHIEKGHMGFVVPNGDVNMLAGIITTLAKDRGKIVNLSEKVRHYNRNYLSRNIRLELYLQILKKVVPT
jgi:glycosyltransferase involved in cell wall biosynthesis